MRKILFILLAACGAESLELEPINGSLAPLTTLVTDIDDTVIWSYGDSFYPTASQLAVGLVDGPDFYQPWLTSARAHRSIVRLATSAIPAGVLTGFRVLITQKSALNSGIADFYRLKDVDVWTEAGADWFHGTHPTKWGGSRNGLGSPGVDYDSSPEGTRPSIAYSPATNGVQFAVELPVAWLEDWRSGARLNNGILMRERFQPANDRAEFASSDAAQDALVFEIDAE